MNKVFLCLGGNLGDKFSNHQRVLKLIEREIGNIILQSTLYESPAWGFSAKEQFLNRVIKVETNLDAFQVLEKALLIEKMFGRKRSEVQYASREMDIDILFYNDEIINEENLIIPHPRLQDRMFVLVPLVEIAPHFVHPLLKKDTIQLLDDCKDDSIITKFNVQSREKMNDNKKIKDEIKQTYFEIASQSKLINTAPCCCNKKNNPTYRIITDDYDKIDGYLPDADLKLGCGLPTEYAKISEGDFVVDLGSGAGNDCFVARAITGASGKVVGIDFTESMVEKAKKNAQKIGADNVEFMLGDIENIPLANHVADVVVSNCVMNLVPDKSKAFKEVYRILKTTGHFSISDIVLVGELPEKIKTPATEYAGCVASAIQKDDYLDIIKNAGFKNIIIQKNQPIVIPDGILKQHLNDKEVEEYKTSETKIFSITVYAEK